MTVSVVVNTTHRPATVTVSKITQVEGGEGFNVEETTEEVPAHSGKTFQAENGHKVIVEEIVKSDDLDENNEFIRTGGSARQLGDADFAPYKDGDNGQEEKAKH